MFRLSNGHSTANFANVARPRLSTRGHVFGAFCVDIVTRQTCLHSLSRVARTRQTRQNLPSRVARTRQTRQHSPKAIFKKNVTRLDKFERVMCNLTNLARVAVP